MFARALEGWHLIVLVVVLLVLFGSKRLPDAARGIGRSLRIFKSEVKELQGEDASATGPDRPRSGSDREESDSGRRDATEQDPDR
jgi:sec-independent protein translocase protein TatA